MRLVRFLQRSFHEATIVEPGTEMMVEDHVVLGAHMVDLTPGAEQPVYKPRVPVFRADLAHVPGLLSPAEARIKATEEAIARAEMSRQNEAAAIAVTIKPSSVPKDQPAV